MINQKIKGALISDCDEFCFFEGVDGDDFGDFVLEGADGNSPNEDGFFVEMSHEKLRTPNQEGFEFVVLEKSTTSQNDNISPVEKFVGLVNGFGMQKPSENGGKGGSLNVVQFLGASWISRENSGFGIGKDGFEVRQNAVQNGFISPVVSSISTNNESFDIFLD